MDIEEQRKAFEKSNNVHPDWSFKFDYELEQYVALDHEMQLQVDEFNEHWDTFRAGWLAAKQRAVPDGFVVVPVEPSEEMIMSVYDDYGDYVGDGLPKDIYKAMIQETLHEND